MFIHGSGSYQFKHDHKVVITEMIVDKNGLM